MKGDTDLIEKELKDSEDDKKAVKKLLKNVEKENHDLKKDKSCATENLLEIKNEFKAYKSAANNERKELEKKVNKLVKKEEIEKPNPKGHFKCSKGNLETEALSDLKCHEQAFHVQTLSTHTEVIILVDKKFQSSEDKSDKGVQIETKELLEPQTRVLEFEEFNCYYCDTKILSESDMEDHRVKCIGKIDYLKTNRLQVHSNLSQEENTNLYQCDYCEAECCDERNRDEHYDQLRMTVYIL